MKSDHDEQRIQQMEREIASLRETVDILRIEIKELKQVACKEDASSDPRRSLYNASHPNNIPSIDNVGMYQPHSRQDYDTRDKALDPNYSFGLQKPGPGVPSTTNHPRPSVLRSSDGGSSTNRRDNSKRSSSSSSMSKHVPAVHTSTTSQYTISLSRAKNEPMMPALPDKIREGEAKLASSHGGASRAQPSDVQQDGKFESLLHLHEARERLIGNIVSSKAGKKNASSIRLSKKENNASSRPAHLSRSM